VSLEVTILGSGTAIPSSQRFPAGVLVRGGGETLLIDVGPGTLRRLPDAGVGLEQITTVLLTHYHTDHTADLASLLFGLRNPRFFGRPPLRVLGAAGLRALVGHLTAAWPWLDPKDSYELRLEEIGPGPFELEGLRGTAVAILHTAQSLAYRLEDDAGRSVAVSGDADVCDGLAEVARGVDLFVCDSAFPDEHRTAGHLTPSLAGEAAAAAGVTTLCLTHFYPECEGHDLQAQARTAFDGEIVLAHDLARFEL